jgi:hypothetical protein
MHTLLAICNSNSLKGMMKVFQHSYIPPISLSNATILWKIYVYFMFVSGCQLIAAGFTRKLFPRLATPGRHFCRYCAWSVSTTLLIMAFHGFSYFIWPFPPTPRGGFQFYVYISGHVSSFILMKYPQNISPAPSFPPIF